MAKKSQGSLEQAGRPRVVFDVKMPEYRYREGETKSMSVDRKRGDADKPSLDCLANLRA